MPQIHNSTSPETTAHGGGEPSTTAMTAAKSAQPPPYSSSPVNLSVHGSLLALTTLALISITYLSLNYHPFPLQSSSPFSTPPPTLLSSKIEYTNLLMSPEFVPLAMPPNNECGEQEEVWSRDIEHEEEVWSGPSSKDCDVIETTKDGKEEIENCEDKVEEPKEGMAFDTPEDAYRYYLRYAQEKGFAIAKRSSRKGSDGNIGFECCRAGKAREVEKIAVGHGFGTQESVVNVLEENGDLGQVSDVYHSAEVFHLNYAEMERRFKVYIYPDGDPNTFYQTPRKLTGKTNLGFWAGHRNSKIRVILARVWENDTELDIANDRIDKAAGPLVYENKFYRNKFCICPGGSQVNSARITDSIHYGCVPVILSNYYDLPFNDILDWRKFSVILEENDVYRLKQILKDISNSEFVVLHENLVKVQKHFQLNSPPVKYNAFHMVMYDLWLRHHVIKY
ncbi:hypothetical protein RHGRI_030119 [Rhododendron griersonianum]|uniref:Exostosin GT47 domain-containing protein n=1 Tax=Rhododendron griersonianum TaxID=479676 RepID=A0AAV6IQ02_9ERIC|nr:hypothetical protein RHGRI_030119 [Rhododendron griersonianum]